MNERLSTRIDRRRLLRSGIVAIAGSQLVAVPMLACAAGLPKVERGPLEQLRWKRRILLVFSPDAGDARARAFDAALTARACEILDRDLAVVRVPAGSTATLDGVALSESAARTIRTAHRVSAETFAVVLVGKDGGEKAHAEAPPELDDLFALIDGMPMRRVEVRTRAEQCAS